MEGLIKMYIMGFDLSDEKVRLLRDVFWYSQDQWPTLKRKYVFDNSLPDNCLKQEIHLTQDDTHCTSLNLNYHQVYYLLKLDFWSCIHRLLDIVISWHIPLITARYPNRVSYISVQDFIKKTSNKIPWIVSRPRFPTISIHCLYLIVGLK